MAGLSRDRAMTGRVPLTLACWDYDRTAAPRLLEPADLFAPETLESYVI